MSTGEECEDYRDWFQEPICDDNIVRGGCFSCRTITKIASMEMVLAVGFGSANASKGDEFVYDEMQHDREHGEGNHLCLQDIENMALKDPEHDWQVTMDAALHGETYQRQGEGKWVLIDSNIGFA